MAIKKVTIGIDEDILKIVDKKAKESSRSRSNYVTFVLTDYIQYEREKENTEIELRNEIEELKKQLLSAIPTKVETKNNDDDLLNPIQFPKFKGGL